MVQQARQPHDNSRQGAAGRGSSKHQQQLQQRSAAVEAQVPAWHKQFLAAVGAQPEPKPFGRFVVPPADTVTDEVASVDTIEEKLDPRNPLYLGMKAMDQAFSRFHAVVFLQNLGAEDERAYCIPDGSLSGVESSLPVRETLLLLLEVMLLGLSEQTQSNCFTRMVNILQSTIAAQGSCTHSGAGTSAAAAGIAAAAAADDVLQPVLQHLAPMVLAEAAEQQCTSSNTASAAAPSPAAPTLRLAALTADTAGTTRTTAAVLAAAKEYRPRTFSDLLELLVITGQGLQHRPRPGVSA
jgi:hypothetical protein